MDNEKNDLGAVAPDSSEAKSGLIESMAEVMELMGGLQKFLDCAYETGELDTDVLQAILDKRKGSTSE